jgi:hypothetical protein
VFLDQVVRAIDLLDLKIYRRLYPNRPLYLKPFLGTLYLILGSASMYSGVKNGLL